MTLSSLLESLYPHNPRYGTGLIPESAEPLEEVIGFWRAYVAERQLHTGIAGAVQ